MSSRISHTLLLDGLAVRTRVDVPGARSADRPEDWHLEFVEGGCALDPAGTNWQGDASEDGAVWGRFGLRDGQVHVHLAGVGDLLASRERQEAVIHVADGGMQPLAAFRRLMPYLASLGGRAVLHAACAVMEPGAVLFLAEARTGKSTLALALDAAGVPVLSDDHVALDPLDGGFVAHPSFAFIDVGLASRELFRPETVDVPGKVSVPLFTAQPTEPVEVAALAFLSRGPAVDLVRMAAPDAAARLLREALFAGDLLDASGLKSRVDGALALANAIPAFSMTLTDGLKNLSAALGTVQALPFGRWA